MKTDGTGAPIVPDKLYFIQNVRVGVAHWALFWGPNSSGYTDDLERAGQYLGSALPARSDDVAWPVELVVERAIIRRLVHVHQLERTP